MLHAFWKREEGFPSHAVPTLRLASARPRSLAVPAEWFLSSGRRGMRINGMLATLACFAEKADSASFHNPLDHLGARIGQVHIHIPPQFADLNALSGVAVVDRLQVGLPTEPRSHGAKAAMHEPSRLRGEEWPRLDWRIRGAQWARALGGGEPWNPDTPTLRILVAITGLGFVQEARDARGGLSLGCHQTYTIARTQAQGYCERPWPRVRWAGGPLAVGCSHWCLCSPVRSVRGRGKQETRNEAGKHLVKVSSVSIRKSLSSLSRASLPPRQIPHLVNGGFCPRRRHGHSPSPLLMPVSVPVPVSVPGGARHCCNRHGIVMDIGSSVSPGVSVPRACLRHSWPRPAGDGTVLIFLSAIGSWPYCAATATAIRNIKPRCTLGPICPVCLCRATLSNRQQRQRAAMMPSLQLVSCLAGAGLVSSDPHCWDASWSGEWGSRTLYSEPLLPLQPFSSSH